MKCRRERVEPDALEVSLPHFWLQKTSPTRAEGMDEVVSAANVPHLALVARVYVGVGDTSLQAEHNLSALLLFPANLRSSMLAFKVE